MDDAKTPATRSKWLQDWVCDAFQASKETSFESDDWCKFDLKNMERDHKEGEKMAQEIDSLFEFLDREPELNGLMCRIEKRQKHKEKMSRSRGTPAFRVKQKAGKDWKSEVEEWKKNHRNIVRSNTNTVVGRVRFRRPASAYIFENDLQGQYDEYSRLLYDMQFREITPDDYETLLRLDEAIRKRTMAKSQVDAFEKVANAEGDCPICITDLKGAAVKLPCGHMFHQECIEIWLTGHASSCPIDREELSSPC